MRKYNGRQPSKTTSVDAFMTYYYWNVEVHNAASLAPNNVVAATELVRVKSKTDTEKKSLQPRHINHMTMEAWYEIYKMWADGSALPEDEIAKVRTFSTTYESIWKPILQMRLNCLSEMATSGDGADEAASILKLDLDGLDQNKTRFRSVTHIFGQVGHTHGPVDQRLSVAVAAFQAMDVIQTPEDFVQCVLEKVKPARGRQLAAELLQGYLNWKEYYEQYGLSVGGLVPNAHRPDDSVNHCWRFIRRSDLPLYDAQSGESWAPAEICEDSGLDQSNNL
ncbi:unnamed protein product [Effrenium voratum]|nr:unnamed protein product [Effrenium voratum]